MKSHEDNTPNTDTKVQVAKAPDFPTPESPLTIPRLTKNSAGGVDIIMSLSQDQTYVLVNFAIMMLVGQGLVVFQDETEDRPQEEKQEKEEPKIQEGEVLAIGKQIH